MDIALRKHKILAAVIESYIATGEPIGSKALLDASNLTVSSATIRNELANLTAEGLLKQPHTSAGRVPTELGYRYYVDNLMEPKPLEDRVKRYIESCLQSNSDAPENILKAACRVVSELSGTVGIATTPGGEEARVHRIKFVRTGRHTSMVVLITSSGMVKSRLFRCDFDITPEMLNVFDRALNERLAGQPLNAVNQPFIQTFAASFGELALLMPDMLTAVMDACREASGMSVYTSGKTKLLYRREFDFIWVRNVLELLSDDGKTTDLFKNVPDGTEIYIGRENSSALLRQCSLAVTDYRIENRPAGTIALIGSLRTDYARAAALIEYTALCTGELISELIEAGS